MKIFPANSLLTEEFEKIRLLAEEECAGALGRKMIRELEPGIDYNQALGLWSKRKNFVVY